MASSGSSGGSGGGGEERHRQNLQGLLKYCAEQTKDEDRTSERPFEPMSDEKDERHSSSSSAKTSTNKTADPEKTSTESDSKMDPSSFWTVMEQARADQDKALNTLGLYRYKVPGDGNCMFRAAASQLKLNQEDYHPKLRKRAVAWMKEHAEELLAGGLLDSIDEIEETAKDGIWPSQAAIVALANVLEVNIAIVQGGDKGNIDIQHITPFETPAFKACKEGIVLGYLYNGHYDGIVNEPKLPNPEYKQWLIDCEEKTRMGEKLARKIERYGSSYGRERTEDPRHPRRDFDDEEKKFRRVGRRWKSPERDDLIKDSIDTLSYRTRNMDLRTDPVSENVKPSMTVPVSASSSHSAKMTHIPVFHETSKDEWSSYTYKDVPEARSSQESSRVYSSGSGSLSSHKPEARVIPIQHTQTSHGSTHDTARYKTESQRYGQYCPEPKVDYDYDGHISRHNDRYDTGSKTDKYKASSYRASDYDDTYMKHIDTRDYINRISYSSVTSPDRVTERRFPHRSAATLGTTSGYNPHYSGSSQAKLYTSRDSEIDSDLFRKPHRHNQYAREVSSEDYEKVWLYRTPSHHDIERRLSAAHKLHGI